MVKCFRIIAVASALSGALAAPAFAQDSARKTVLPSRYSFTDGRSGGAGVPSSVSGAVPSTQPRQDLERLRAERIAERKQAADNEWLGRTVRAPIGKVSDLYFDDQGNISAVAIESGLAHGDGDKYVVVPWDRIEPTGGDNLAVDRSASQIARMPSYSESELRARDKGQL